MSARIDANGNEVTGIITAESDAEDCQRVFHQRTFKSADLGMSESNVIRSTWDFSQLSRACELRLMAQQMAIKTDKSARGEAAATGTVEFGEILVTDEDVMPKGKREKKSAFEQAKANLAKMKAAPGGLTQEQKDEIALLLEEG